MKYKNLNLVLFETSSFWLSFVQLNLLLIFNIFTHHSFHSISLQKGSSIFDLNISFLLFFLLPLFITLTSAINPVLLCCFVGYISKAQIQIPLPAEKTQCFSFTTLVSSYPFFWPHLQFRRAWQYPQILALVLHRQKVQLYP